MTQDLRSFIKLLEEKNQLHRIKTLVDPDLEIAEICNRMLQKGGPALLFENVKGAKYPIAINLMGTVERICWAMNMQNPLELEELGKKLAMLQQPKPPKKISQAIDFGKVLFDVLKAKPGHDFFPPCQQIIIENEDIDLNDLPLIRPYPQDAGKIITLGLVITKDCETGTPNVGVYRLQLQSKNTMTVHWLSVRGGARHLRKAAEKGKKLEIAIAIGVHPLIIMAAATPIPVDLSEWLFAGLYAGS
ncbi:MAG TPA: UbiD family decarboxylase, partial [Allocoleopsis sp.]